VVLFFSKVALSALPIPPGIGADLLAWVLPSLNYLGVQSLWWLMCRLHLDQGLRKLAKKVSQFWIGLQLACKASPLLADIAELVGNSRPDSTKSPIMELQWFFQKLEGRILSFTPISSFLTEIFKSEGAVDHDVDVNVSREVGK